MDLIHCLPAYDKLLLGPLFFSFNSFHDSLQQQIKQLYEEFLEQKSDSYPKRIPKGEA